MVRCHRDLTCVRFVQVQETRRQGAERERAKLTRDAIVRIHKADANERCRDHGRMLTRYCTAAGWGRRQWLLALLPVRSYDHGLKIRKRIASLRFRKPPTRRKPYSFGAGVRKTSPREDIAETATIQPSTDCYV